MFKIIGLFLIVIGVYMILYKIIVNENKRKKKRKIEYRFIPRTFVMEQNNLPLPSDVFSKMFSDPSVWMGYTDLDSKQQKVFNDLNRTDKKSLKIIEKKLLKKKRKTKRKKIIKNKKFNIFVNDN